MKRVVLMAIAFAIGPSVARAYSDTTTFARDPSSDTAGGGGGFYFTGSPRQHGLDCAACHIEGPPGTALRLSALLDGEATRLFRGKYQPGAVYELEVAFDGELLAPPGGCGDQTNDPCDLNLFALEILDEKGQPAGALCPVTPRDGEAHGCDLCSVRRARGTIAEEECSVIVADGFDETALSWRNGVAAYSFFWNAPAEDVGPVLVYVSGVDGRGREVEGGEATSYVDDGVVTVRVPIDSPAHHHEEPSSCAAVSSDSGGGALPIVLLAGLTSLDRCARARRRRRHPSLPRAPRPG